MEVFVDLSEQDSVDDYIGVDYMQEFKGNTFQVGDEVVINIEGVYYGDGDTSNPSDTRGIVFSVSEIKLGLMVEWDNDTYNSYNHSDLLPWKEPTSDKVGITFLEFDIPSEVKSLSERITLCAKTLDTLVGEQKRLLTLIEKGE